MQTIAALQDSARTWLVHTFGCGLDGENRFVVERFKAMLDGDIRPVQPEAAKVNGRRRANRVVVSRKEVEALRSARTEIIVCTGLRTRGGLQLYGDIATGVFHDRRQRGLNTDLSGVPPAASRPGISDPEFEHARRTPWPIETVRLESGGTASVITGALPNGAPPAFARSADVARPRRRTGARRASSRGAKAQTRPRPRQGVRTRALPPAGRSAARSRPVRAVRDRRSMQYAPYQTGVPLAHGRRS